MATDFNNNNAKLAAQQSKKNIAYWIIGIVVVLFAVWGFSSMTNRRHGDAAVINSQQTPASAEMATPPATGPSAVDNSTTPTIESTPATDGAGNTLGEAPAQSLAPDSNLTPAPTEAPSTPAAPPAATEAH